MPIRDVTLLHDNSRPHTTILTKDKLEEMGWETIEHLPYSPDYFLFAQLNETIVEWFESNKFR